MFQTVTISQIASVPAALAAANSQVIFGVGDVRAQPCEETSCAFDCTPSSSIGSRSVVDARRFADSPSLVYSLSPSSNDGPASSDGADAPPPSGSSDDNGDGSDRPAPEISAYDVFYALFSVTMRHEVRFGEALAVYLIHTKGWIEEVSDAKRRVMNETAHSIEGLERELEDVKRTLRKKETVRHKFKIQAESLLQDVTSIFSRRVSSGTVRKKPLKKLSEDIEDLRKDKEELKGGISRAKIAKEWLDRIGWSEYGFVSLTDAGLEVLGKLKAFKDDEKMMRMSVDEYLSEVVDSH